MAWQLEPEWPIADVVYFHGNGGNLSIWLPVFATLHASGLRVLAVDYRGYGLSTGRPSEAGVYRDAVAVAFQEVDVQGHGLDAVVRLVHAVRGRLRVRLVLGRRHRRGHG